MYVEIQFRNDETTDRFKAFVESYKDEISIDIDGFDWITVYTSATFYTFLDGCLMGCLDFGADIKFEFELSDISEISW